VVDCKRGTVKRRRSDSSRAASGSAATEVGSGRAGDPVFRIDGNDLLFLRSIGIDPTRKSRARRSKS
jgi:hypothetical protein